MNAHARIKMNPPLGQLPVLQYCAPDQLQIDADYQRSLDTERSQSLIRRIAAHWDWGLCQPLFVARREGGGLFVVDGQHRLAAAKLRGDIWQLPCVVTHFDSAAQEAASFVALNQQRRPLTHIELFKAAVAAGEPDARQIVKALAGAGLALANSTNNQSMRAGQVANVGGLRLCLRLHGPDVLAIALRTLAAAYPDQMLRYAGSIFPGIASLVDGEVCFRTPVPEIVEKVAAFVARRTQAQWIKQFALAMAEDTNLKRSGAAKLVMRRAWRDRFKTPQTAADGPVPTSLLPAERAWCEQCDQIVSGAKAGACVSPFCSLKARDAGSAASTSGRREAA